MNNVKKLRMFFRLSWEVAPSYIMLLIFHTAMTGIQIVLNIIFPRFLIDESIGGRELCRLFLLGGLVVGSNLFFFGWIAL